VRKRAQVNVKRLLNLLDRSVHFQQGSVGMPAGDPQPVSSREIFDCGIILRRRPELRHELVWRQVMAIIRAGPILELLEQIGQISPVAQRQSDDQVQALRRGEPSTALYMRCCCWDMALQRLGLNRAHGGSQ